MDYLFAFVSQFWRQQMAYEIEKQSVKASVLALKALLSSTRRLVGLALYILLFLYSLFGAITVAVNAESFAAEARPLIIYCLLSLIFGAVLIYNLREQTWIRRWGIAERIYNLERRAEHSQREAFEDPAAQFEEQLEARLEGLLDKFEGRVERRLKNFERRQKAELQALRRAAKEVPPPPYPYRDAGF